MSRKKVTTDQMDDETRNVVDSTGRREAEALLIAQRDLNVALGTVSDLDDAFTLCVDAVLQISLMDAAIVYTINADSSLSLLTHKGISDSLATEAAHFPKESEEAKSVATGSPIYDALSSLTVSKSLNGAFQSKGFRSGALIPITHQDRPIHCLYLASRRFDEVPKDVKYAAESTLALIGGALVRIKAEANIRRDRKMLEDLINAINDGLALKDEEGRFLIANRALASSFGMEPQDLVGKSLSEVTTQEVVEKSRQSIHKIFTAGESIRFVEINKGQYFEKTLNPVVASDEGISAVASLRRDITEFKKWEEAILETEEICRALLETIDTGYVIADGQGKVLDANSEYVRLSGHKSIEEIRGRSVLEWTAEYDLARNSKEVSKSIEQGFARNLEIDYVDPTGQIIPIELNATVIHKKDDIRIVALSRDATQRRQAAEALKESEERFRSLFDQAADAVFVHDLEGKILDVNRQACISLDYTRGELLSMSVNDFDPDTEQRKDKNKFWGKESVTLESRHRRKDGTIFHVEIHPGTITYGETKVVLVVARDITERKQVEKQLKESEERYRTLAESSLTGICVQQGHKVVYANEYLARFLGYAVDEVIGKPAAHFILPQDREMARTIGLARLRGEAIPSQYELRLMTRDGKVRWVEVVAGVIQQDGLPAVLSNILDITNLKQVAKELEESKNAAEAANRTKSEFLANMSHELRTPLNAVIGFAELLEDQVSGPLNADQHEEIKYIVESGHHLLELVNSILDLARIESEGMRIVHERVNVIELLENSIGTMNQQALKRNLLLTLKVDSELGVLTITADELKIKQVMLNLLSNAIKFTPDGGSIHVTARRCEDDLEIGVADNGLGIEHADMSRIFESFEQVDSSFSRQFQGTGLGLPLSRKLVELHGGRIWVESDGINKGSTFKFVIPVTVQ